YFLSQSPSRYHSPLAFHLHSPPLFYLMLPRPPRPTLFPYTTLFRSLTEHAVKVLDDRLAEAVEVPVQRVEKTVEGLEERVVRLGSEKLAELTGRAHEVVSAVGRAERRVERLSARVTWATVGRMCLALVPFTVAFIMLTGMVGGITQMLGLGPLLGWAWDSFAAASAWWAKALIALAALGGCGLFAWLLWWL